VRFACPQLLQEGGPGAGAAMPAFATTSCCAAGKRGQLRRTTLSAAPCVPQSEIKKSYDLGADLGSGNFAVVRKAKNKNYADGGQIPETVAVKIINKAKVEDMNDIQREIEIMQMVDHKNVIKLYEIFDEPKQMHLVMELVTGGELFDRIVAKGNYTEKDAAVTIRTLCDALGYLHEKRIVHRDLKPENLLYASPDDDAAIKIADFGLARLVSSKDLMKTACGTPGYVAPEILKNQGYDSGAVDMWSTGVILYILLCGFPPFYEEELPALFDQIMNARFDFPSPWWDDISKGAKDVIRKCLELSPKKRMTADEALKDPWISGGAAPDTKLDKTVAALKKYNASRKLRRVALGVIAQQRMARALEGLGKK